MLTGGTNVLQNADATTMFSRFGLTEQLLRSCLTAVSSHACNDQSHLYSHCKTGGCKGPVISIKQQTPGSA